PGGRARAGHGAVERALTPAGRVSAGRLLLALGELRGLGRGAGLIERPLGPPGRTLITLRMSMLATPPRGVPPVQGVRAGDPRAGQAHGDCHRGARVGTGSESDAEVGPE